MDGKRSRSAFTAAETEALISPAVARAYTWTRWLLSLIIGSLVLALLTGAFQGLTLDRPAPLVITLLALLVTHTAIDHSLSALRRGQAQRAPLARRAAAAVAALQSTAEETPSCIALMATLADEITQTLHPRAHQHMAYDPRTDSYRAADNSAPLPADHPHISWISQCPEAVPMSLHKQAPDSAVALELWEKGYRVVISLGRAGWILLTPPEGRNGFAENELSFLELVSGRAAPMLQRAALVEIQEKRGEELQVLYWIAQAVNFGTDVDSLLELVYTQLRRVMPLPNFYIALLDPERDELSFAFYIEDDERRYLDETWSTAETLTGAILKNHTTIRTEDYTAACQQRDLQPQGPSIPTTWMGTALSAGSRNIGVMVASGDAPELRFTQADENLFVTVAAYTAAILERHALTQRLEARARQLTTLNEIGNLLASSLDLDEVLNLVVRNAAELLDSEAGSLLLRDDETGDLVFRISSGPAAEHLVGMRIPAGKGIAGAAFSENRPVISQHTHDDTRWYPDFDAEAAFVTESILAVPLNARGRTIGVLEVVNRQGDQRFTAEDSELLLSFGAQAAIAIENARLFTSTDQALQERLQELTTLQRIDRQLNATLDYNMVMHQTLEWALQITGAAIGIVAALQEDAEGRRGLRFLAYQGYDDEEMQQYHTEELWPLDKGLIGHTVTLSETTLVTDSDADHQEELEPGMAAQLTTPIKREGRVIGAIVLEATTAEAFTAEHIAFVERLADHAAIAIDNARLFEQVQSANAAKTEFISFVSHELKQPMTSIKGYADLLIKGVGGELNELQTQFTTVVRNNVARMDRLVQDLLDVSRIEAGRLKLDLGPVTPAEVVTEAAQAFEQAIAEKSQTLQVEVQPDLPTLTGDRGRLIQVLTNLVSNANKYTPEGGRITLRVDEVSQDGSTHIRWQVADTGIGMSEDEVQQLFTKYFRSQRTAVRSVQGTGLGLVISRSIVELHGGEMTVESAVDQGSTFSFTVPVSAPD